MGVTFDVIRSVLQSKAEFFLFPCARSGMNADQY